MNAAYSFVYAVTVKSVIAVLSELLKVSEVGVDRIAETRDGFVAAISIPGDPNSGAVYVFDRPTASMSIFSLDNRDSNFTAKEIGEIFPAVVKHLNTPSPSKQAVASKKPEIKQAQRVQLQPRQQKHRQQNRSQQRHNNHPQRKGQNIGAPVRQKQVQVPVAA